MVIMADRALVDNRDIWEKSYINSTVKRSKRRAISGVLDLKDFEQGSLLSKTLYNYLNLTLVNLKKDNRIQIHAEGAGIHNREGFSYYDQFVVTDYWVGKRVMRLFLEFMMAGDLLSFLVNKESYRNYIRRDNRLFSIYSTIPKSLIFRLRDNPPEYHESPLYIPLDFEGSRFNTFESPTNATRRLIIDHAYRNHYFPLYFYPGKKSLYLIYEKDGLFHDLMCPPRHIYDELLASLKVMAGLDASRSDLLQEGIIRIEFLPEHERIELLIAIVPLDGEEGIIIQAPPYKREVMQFTAPALAKIYELMSKGEKDDEDAYLDAASILSM
jgi:hypothetical protein